MYHIFCIHFSVEGHLGFFQLLAIINKAAMNRVEHVSLLHAGVSSGYMPRSGIARSSDSTMHNFLRNRQTDFQSGCTSLQSYQQWRSVPLSPHPCQHVLSLGFLIFIEFNEDEDTGYPNLWDTMKGSVKRKFQSTKYLYKEIIAIPFKGLNNTPESSRKE